MLQKNGDYKLLWNGFYIYSTGTPFFLQKLELGKSQSYVIFRCWWPPPRCGEGEKVGISFDLLFGWNDFFISLFLCDYLETAVQLCRSADQYHHLGCHAQASDHRECADWWYNHQVDNALCLKKEWENFKDSGLILPSLMCPERGREKLIYCEWMQISLPLLICCERNEQKF